MSLRSSPAAIPASRKANAANMTANSFADVILGVVVKPADADQATLARSYATMSCSGCSDD